jgi:aspartate/tyrosine/aromatic aminotransferase
MITEPCSECNKEFNVYDMSIVSCSILKHDNKYISTIKVTRYSSTNRNIRYPHKSLCRDCAKIVRDTLQNDELRNITSFELLDLISGKSKRIAICNALEEGNGK